MRDRPTINLPAYVSSPITMTYTMLGHMGLSNIRA